MSRAALAFSAATLAPVPLLALAAWSGGAWAWIALFYLTGFTFAGDVLTARAAGASRKGAEFPAHDLLSAALALAHLPLLAVIVAGFGRGIGAAEGTALFLAAGLYLGQVGSSNAHELIHRNGRALATLGKWVYISLLFGHHVSAHKLVHHRFVGTDADPNTPRPGEGYYRFALRAWWGSFRAGFRAETARRYGRPLCTHPYILYLAGAAVFVGAAWATGRGAGLSAYLGLCLFAQSQLLVSDYVQHYGLRRRELPDGRLEPVGPQHSWNAGHAFSRHLMLNAPRHSDHHAHPARPYPALTLPPDVPTLPSSLPAMSALALVPPLWRRVMAPRVADWRRRTPLASAA